MPRSFFLFAFILLLFIQNNVFSQTKIEIAQSKKNFEGTWYNKTTRRYISIFYDDDIDYVTINDWIKGQRQNGDAYKAFTEGQKLILYAENIDHHAPYCEIEIVNKKLIYLCNQPFNFKDNFITTGEHVDKVTFERIKE